MTAVMKRAADGRPARRQGDGAVSAKCWVFRGGAPLMYTLFFALFLAPLVGYQALIGAFRLALREDAYTHILLILPICLLLIVLKWRKQACKPKPSPIAGLTVFSLAILIALTVASWQRTQSIPADVALTGEMLAIVIWWIGSFLACFGRRVSRICLFPLLFLLLLVPLPNIAVSYIVEFLQQGTATCSRLMFTILGIPALQDGTILAIPGLTLQVAEQCSSIRSSMMLVVSAMVASNLLLRTAWTQAFVILAAIPLAIAKNGLRVVVLAVLGQYVDRGFLTGWLHHNGGPLFFAVSLIVMFAMIRFLSRLESRGSYTPQKCVYRVATPGAAD